MRGSVSTARLIFNLIMLHFRGWKQVSGYTVMEQEPDGSVYFAIQLHLPHPAKATGQ